MEKNKDGIVIRGAFLLDTQGATADVILVFPAPFSFTVEEESPYSFAYAVPSNLEGISFLCRESFVGGESTYNDPLSSRLEEMDTLVIFDDVTVPWDRVFICGDEKMACRLLDESHFSHLRRHADHLQEHCQNGVFARHDRHAGEDGRIGKPWPCYREGNGGNRSA